MTMDIPFLRPNPPKLSELVAELGDIEASHTYSNYGPVNTRLEQSMMRDFFAGQGSCVSVCNATIGLMLAIRLAIGSNRDRDRRYALMPSFTFAATGHAAIWTGLTPLLCDIEPDSWLASASAEHEMIERYREQIAVIVPYATFGNNLDLERYRTISEKTGIPVVVDAAASLGSRDDHGNIFGTGFRHPVVYSMHVTKTFATSEAGLIYCADVSVVNTLRAMGNFGFEHPRTATIPGLNSKLSEVAALLALRKLHHFDDVITHRLALVNRYREMLPEWTFQRRIGRSYAYQFVSVLPPSHHSGRRAAILDQLSASGIGFGTYFDPHLADQQYFQATSVSGDLTETSRIARQIISLPLSDFMTEQDVETVCGVLQRACAR